MHQRLENLYLDSITSEISNQRYFLISHELGQNFDIKHDFYIEYDWPEGWEDRESYAYYLISDPRNLDPRIKRKMIRIPNDEMKESEKKCDFYSKFFDH